MINAGEVGAVFKIGDELSPVIKRLMDQFNALGGVIDRVKLSMAEIKFPPGLNHSIGNMGKALKGVSDQADAMAAATAKGFGSIDAAVATTQAKIAQLSNEIRGLGAESKGIGLGAGAPAGIRARAAGGSRDPHITARQPLGGPFHIGGGSLPAVGTAAAVGLGVWDDAKLKDTIFQLLYHTGLPDTAANESLFRKNIQDAMSLTGFSLDDVSKASLAEARMFRGTPGNGVDVLPTMLKVAAIEARLKGTSLSESMTAFIGLAHMTKQYGAAAIEKLAPAFAFLSSSNPASLTSMERAAGYAVPILQSGLDIDPVQSLLLGTALTRAGAINSKSGTWLRNMVLGAMPGTSVMSDMAYKKHEKALRALGLVDSHDQPTWFTDGKPDPFKMLDIASAHAAGIPLADRAGYEKQLFGSQGYGGFALLADPAVRAQIVALNGEMNSPEFKARYGTFMQDYNATSPLQEGRGSWADLQIVLMDIGQSVLPIATGALTKFDGALKVIRATLGDSAGNSVVGGAVLAGTAKLLFPNATKGVLGMGGRLMGAAGPWGWLASAIGLTEWLDPKGNFGGLTTPVDNWFKQHLGFDPSNTALGGSMNDPSWALNKDQYIRQALAKVADRERASHGAAWGGEGNGKSTGRPPAAVNTKVSVSVFVDGKNIPSTSTTRVVNDASGFDGQDGTPYPDHMH